MCSTEKREAHTLRMVTWAPHTAALESPKSPLLEPSSALHRATPACPLQSSLPQPHNLLPISCSNACSHNPTHDPAYALAASLTVSSQSPHTLTEVTSRCFLFPTVFYLPGCRFVSQVNGIPSDSMTLHTFGESARIASKVPFAARLSLSTPRPYSPSQGA